MNVWMHAVVNYVLIIAKAQQSMPNINVYFSESCIKNIGMFLQLVEFLILILNVYDANVLQCVYSYNDVRADSTYKYFQQLWKVLMQSVCPSVWECVCVLVLLNILWRS